MDRIPALSNQLTLRDVTLGLYAKRADDAAGYDPLGLLGEFDADLTFAYWADEGGHYDWTLTDVSVEWNYAGKDVVNVTRESDPEMWLIIRRAVRLHTHIDEWIRERITEIEEA